MTEPLDPIAVLAGTDDLAFVRSVLRYLDGLMEAEEVAALSQALREDGGRRDLFVAVACLQEYISRLETSADDASGLHLLDLEALAESGASPEADDLMAGLLSDDGAEGGGTLELVRLDEAAVHQPPVPAAPAAPTRPGQPVIDDGVRKDVILNFAGLYVARRDADPGGGMKLKHLGWAAALLVVAYLGWGWYAQRSSGPAPEPPVVATVTGQADAVWDRGDAVRVGAGLRQDESVVLSSGLLRIQTQRGATVLAEGPCELTFVDDNRVFMARGRLSASVPDARAHGFVVDTPGAEVMDLGTEFGVEVDRSANTRAAVFDGKVVLTAPSSRAAQAGEEGFGDRPLELTVGRTARASAAGQIREDATPSADLANSFRWSLDPGAALPADVMAYWRFEEAPLNRRLTHQDLNDSDRTRIAAKDWSGRGNHLYAFMEDLAPWGVDAVPAPVVPGLRLFNQRSVRNYGQTAQLSHNLYTRGWLDGGEPPLELAAMDRWTIELSVRPQSNKGTQSLIAKQYVEEFGVVRSRLPNQGCVLVVQLVDGFLGVELLDDNGRLHTFTGRQRIATDRWHHVAVVFDGDTLDAYVRPEGRAYYAHEQLATSVPETSLVLLEASLQPQGERLPVEWNLGGLATQERNASVMLDEVRISRVALPVDRFLFASPHVSAMAVGVPTSD